MHIVGNRSQWGRVLFKGNGPIMRAVNSKDLIGAYLFDRWHRFYFSLDEFGLFFFENKFSMSATYSVPCSDFKALAIVHGKPSRTLSGGKAIVEDLSSVVLTTYSGDELHCRFGFGHIHKLMMRSLQLFAYDSQISGFCLSHIME